ncbi:GNAT family N-acetyltransferase [Brevibacillus ruminantium]|uniref:GNAT family N-acetyltransferase n=1 Tax=Brevibacillus ruminantium TaxID=2950604 RepID=A0ABY4WLD6_9BACL|nr:GNAT family N-acetyltransferase [Brevibacillus ruminantium]USG67674.1 GNAT family N-acetyltransferase [Brevibacillus ruminantium]
MLETERLCFRPYTMDDLKFVMTMTSDPDMMRFIGNGAVWTREETTQRLQGWIERYRDGLGTGLLVAVKKSNGELIGHAGLVAQVVEGQEEIEIGYWVAKKYWGHGFATEAALAMRDHGLSQLGQKRMVSLIQFDNHPSANVAQKIGMVFERKILYKGKEIALYALTR